MLIHIALASAFLAMATLARAQDQSVPINASIFYPLDTNAFQNVSENSLCIGFFHCHSPSLSGLSMSLIANSTKANLSGASLSYLANYVGGTGIGLEGATLLNVNGGSFYGLQLSLVNIVMGPEIEGAQVGFINIKSEGNAVVTATENSVDKAEISAEETGFAWPALQAGIINYSGDSEVIPLGFLNFVKGGRFSIQLTHGIFNLNRMSIISGSRYFYTVIDLDSRDLNPSKDSIYHPDINVFQGIGLGAALPIPTLDTVMFRFELIETSPTNYARDLGNLFSYLFEYSPTPYYEVHAGLEYFRFKRDPWSQSLPNESQNYAFSFGASINLLGAWR